MKTRAEEFSWWTVCGWFLGSLMIAQAASPACLRSIAREQLTLKVKGCQTVEELMMSSRQLARGDRAKLEHLNLLKPMPGALVLEASLVRREIILTASDEWASPEPFSIPRSIDGSSPRARGRVGRSRSS
jgi:hypothetical protein